MSLEKLQAYETETKKCFRCSLCKMVPLAVYQDVRFSNNCPINNYYQFHAWSGSGQQFMALALAQGRIQADETLADIVFSCRSCGYCDVACKYIMDAERHLVNMALKETLVEAGLAPAEYKEAALNLKSHGSPLGTGGISWEAGLGLKQAARTQAKVLLWAGCSARHDPEASRTARLLARLLQKAGVDFAVYGDEESCCGLPAYWSGFREQFVESARKAKTLIEKSGAKTVVTVCGACLGTMRSKAPVYGIDMDAEILHATEYLERLIRKKRLTLTTPVNRSVTYHDPCYLGRQAEPPNNWHGQEKTVFGQMVYTDPPKTMRYGTEGVFDPPRAILKAIPGVAFTEMHRIREYAFCCGGGGGQAKKYDAMAQKAASSRIAEAKDAGAETLVTACPHCRQHLGKAAQDMSVLDIIDLTAQAAGIEENQGR